MIQKPVFPANADKEFKSYYAGYSFGLLYHNYKPGKSIVELYHVASTLRVNVVKLYPEYYKLGFLEAYISASGNRLPDELVKEEKRLMSKLSDAKKSVEQESQFVSARFLIDADANFCITSITEETGNLGPQWLLNILVQPEVFGREGEPVGKVLSFVKGKDRVTGQPKENSRDRLLSHLLHNVDMPVHSVTLFEVPNANGYIDIDESTDVCPCGYIEVDGEFDEDTHGQ